MKHHFNPKLIAYLESLFSQLANQIVTILDYYWKLSPEKRYRLRLAAFAFAILVIGFTIGRITNVNREVRIEAQERQLMVDKTGAMSLQLPGVTLNPEIYQFERLKLEALPQELKVPGRLTFNAEQGKLLSSRVTGRVERIYTFEGSPVKVGSPVLELYSPEFQSAQQEYLITNRTVKILSEGTTLTNLLADAKITLDAATNRLRNLGFADADILQLSKTGQANPNLIMRSPISGIVVKRHIEPGASVAVGEPLVFLANPNALWFVGNVFEQDARLIERGQSIKISLEAFPDREIFAKVNYVAPTIDSQTRGLLIRADIANPDGFLRPDMFANARLQIGLAQAIAVPQAAIVRDKDIRYAFIRTSSESYRRVIVKGYDLDGRRFAITEGVSPNDEILTQGAVLLNERFSKQD